MENQPVKLTKRVVDAATPPTDKKQAFIRDSQLPGFALRITAKGVKAFVVEKRIHGKLRRPTLGRYGEITVEQARGMAQHYLGQIAFGADPIADKKTAQARKVTLAEAFRDFKQARKNLKPKTLTGYQQHLEHYLSAWMNKPITQITKQAVSKRHQQIGAGGTQAQANAVFRTLKAVLNFARHHYEDGKGETLLPYNPVEVLGNTRAWYPSKQRQSVIKAHELAPWYQAVQGLKTPDKPASSHVIADFLRFVLFTGLRFNEAATLRWDQVDKQERSLHLPDPKNRQPFTLPLSDVALGILAGREAALEGKDEDDAGHVYVFPNRDGTGHLVEPRRQMNHVTEVSGVSFTVHDLRRTFATGASACGVPHELIKRLLNHKSGDVTTKHYIVNDVEHMRAPMHQVTEFLKDQCQLQSSSNVIRLNTTNNP